MADISKINVNNTNYDIKDAIARGLIWQGTQAQYDAITTKNPDVVYFITDAVTVACSADEISYDNIISGLSATNVQSAIDELSSEKADSSSLATVAISGSYSDLSNKPTIPAAQVNSDWSASSGVSEILNKPTTLSGYGITDAKITSGTITLGSNTITPLTQHQSVTDNNPTLAWGAKSKVATIGSTEINVTMPTNPDTNTTYTFADGTNGFTVTPSDGTAQTVTVTPDLQLEGTASGSVASFTDGGDNIPLKSLIANITAVQSGSGTPSPSNVRAISGWGGVNVSSCGSNVWSEEWEQGIYNPSGNKEANTNAIRAKNPIPVKSGESYVIVGLSSNRVCYYDKAGVFVSTATNQTVITIPNNVFFMTFSTGTSYGGSYNNDISINYPSTDTTYHTYKGTTYTIALGSTVYGGTLNVTKGILTVTHGIIDLGDFTWYYSSTQVRFYTSIGNYDIFPHSTGTIADLVCDSYNNVPFTNVTSDTTLNNVIAGTYTTADYITVRDTRYARSVDFQAAVAGVKAIIPLATPVVINLTKTQVATLLGENHIFANSGNISIDYFTQNAKDISDVANSSDKMDFSNPTGIGSLSLNRKDGTTIGENSVALGLDCTASGERCLAEGSNTQALGNTSHTEGVRTIAKHRSQHVFGDYNDPDPSGANPNEKGTYIEIVGKGTSDANRSNARTLDWNGNETLAGDLTIKGNVSVGDAITLNTSGTASARVTGISVLRSKIVNFNGIKFFNATIRADADIAGGTSILDVSTGFNSTGQQSLLVTASTGGTIQAYISSSIITITNASSLVSGTVYYIIGWYT